MVELQVEQLGKRSEHAEHDELAMRVSLNRQLVHKVADP